jgi:chemotaxis protein CheC
MVKKLHRKATQISEEDKEQERAQGWTKLDREILLELGNIGAGHATSALAEIIQERIEVEVPKIHILPPHRMPKIFGKHDQPTIMVYMELRGEADCDILLLFEEQEARKIAAMMTMTPSPDDVEPEMEASAIEELGSIMIGAFLSAIADFTGIQLVPMPPQLAEGPFDAILDTFLVKQALMSDVALLFGGCFRRSNSEAGGNIVVFPSTKLQEILIKKSQSWLDTGVDETSDQSTCP